MDTWWLVAFLRRVPFVSVYISSQETPMRFGTLRGGLVAGSIASGLGISRLLVFCRRFVFFVAARLLVASLGAILYVAACISVVMYMYIYMYMYSAAAWRLVAFVT